MSQMAARAFQKSNWLIGYVRAKHVSFVVACFAATSRAVAYSG